MASGLCRAWKRESPTHVTWIVDEECAPLIKGQPYADRLIVLPVSFSHRYKQRTVVDPEVGEERFPIEEARREYPQVFAALPRRADRVVNLQFNAAASMVAGSIDTAERWGPYSGDGGGKRVEDVWSQYYLATGADIRFPIVHWTDAFMNIGRGPRDDIRTVFETAPDAAPPAALRQALGDAPYVVAQVAAFEEQKRWPLECFVDAMSRIAAARDCGVVLVGGKRDRVLCLRAERDLSKLGTKVANLAGQTGFHELAIILDGSEGLVSNDTFTQHLSSARDVPTVTVFQGDTSPWLTLGYREGNRGVANDDGSPPSVDRVVGAFLGDREDHLVARRVETYQVPMPSASGPQTEAWATRWAIGSGHLRALEPGVTLGTDAKVEFPKEWLDWLERACAAIDRGETVGASYMEQRLLRDRHPLMALGIMLIARIRYSPGGGDPAALRATYQWLADALRRAGRPT